MSLIRRFMLNRRFTVLHPCLRSHWFATTANAEDQAGQEQAINQAELVSNMLPNPTSKHKI